MPFVCPSVSNFALKATEHIFIKI